MGWHMEWHRAWHMIIQSVCSDSGKPTDSGPQTPPQKLPPARALQTQNSSCPSDPPNLQRPSNPSSPSFLNSWVNPGILPNPRKIFLDIRRFPQVTIAKLWLPNFAQAPKTLPNLPEPPPNTPHHTHAHPAPKTIPSLPTPKTPTPPTHKHGVGSENE